MQIKNEGENEIYNHNLGFKNKGGYDGFFATQISQYCADSNHWYERNKGIWGVNQYHWGRWQNKVDEKIKELVAIEERTDVNAKYQALGGRSGSGTNSGNSIYVKNLYIYAQICVITVGGWYRAPSPRYWYKISWPSGETVNGAGYATTINGDLVA